MWASPANSAPTGLGTNGVMYALEGAPPYIGQIFLQPDNGQNQGVWLVPNSAYPAPSAGASQTNTQQQSWPLLERAGWKMTYVFSIERLNPNGSTAFSTADASIYIGLQNTTWEPGSLGFYFSAAGQATLRPPIFFGLRMDTDTGVSITSSAGGASVGAASGAAPNITTYTMSSNFSAAQVLQFQLGALVTVTGCANSANNGTFPVGVIPTSSTKTIGLVNPNGAIEAAQTITLTIPSINDGGTWFAECCMNQPYQSTTYSPTSVVRNNNLGTGSVLYGTASAGSVSTGIAITEGTFYRLEIWSPAIGTIIISLFGGGASFSQVFTLSQMTLAGTTSSAQTLSSGSAGGILQSKSWGTASAAGTGNTALGNTALIGPGSNVVISGCTGTTTNFNGIYTCIDYDTQVLYFLKVVTPITGTTGSDPAGAPLLTYWPTVFPVWAAGQNTSGAGGATQLAWGLAIDFFDFVWNPILIGQNTYCPVITSAACTTAGNAAATNITEYSGFSAWSTAQVASLQVGTWVQINGFTTHTGNNGIFQVAVAPTVGGTILFLINPNGTTDTSGGTLTTPPAANANYARYIAP